MNICAGIYFAVNFLHCFLVKIRPVVYLACFIRDKKCLLRTQRDRRVRQRIGIEIIYYRKTVIEYVS